MALKIEFHRKAYKEYLKAPSIVKQAVEEWLISLKTIGVELTRIQGGKGLHDEPLKGQRLGQRSIRLNRSWRLIYEVEQGEVKIVKIVSVTKHDYR